MAASFAEIEVRAGVLLVRTTGDLDVSCAGRLQQTVLDAVPNSVAGIVIDLTRSRYVDSSGIRVLFSIARRLHTRRQQLVVAIPQDAPVRRILSYADIPSMIALHESADAAVGALRTEPDEGPAANIGRPAG